MDKQARVAKMTRDVKMTDKEKNVEEIKDVKMTDKEKNLKQTKYVRLTVRNTMMILKRMIRKKCKFLSSISSSFWGMYWLLKEVWINYVYYRCVKKLSHKVSIRSIADIAHFL